MVSFFSFVPQINNVGTLDAIDANLLDDFSYVALGHIHRPQKIKRKTIRYSGTPLKYSFSEAKDVKSVVVFDTNDIENLELFELKPQRELSVLRGTFEEVMNMKPSDDIIKVELEDENTIISPMEEIKNRFKNAIALTFINKNQAICEDINLEIKEDESPYELFKKFFYEQNGRELSKEENEFLQSAIDAVKEDE